MIYYQKKSAKINKKIFEICIFHTRLYQSFLYTQDLKETECL